MFKALKGGGSSHHKVSAKKRKTLKNIETFFGRDSQLFAVFAFGAGSWNLTPAKSEG
jgi:hypothetical protein